MMQNITERGVSLNVRPSKGRGPQKFSRGQASGLPYFLATLAFCPPKAGTWLRHCLYCRFIKVPYLKIFWEKTPSVVIICFFHGKFSKNWAFFNHLKGVVMTIVSGGKPPDPQFSFLRSHRLSTPLYEFCFSRLYLDSWHKCVPTFRHFQLHLNLSIFKERRTVLSICYIGFVKAQTQNLVHL